MAVSPVLFPEGKSRWGPRKGSGADEWRRARQEALADSFEAMNLIEDALIQYDELEASFFQALKGD